MRDALSIMDQAIAFGDEHLTLQDALDVTGSVDEAALNELFKDVIDGNVKNAFTRYHQFISEGKEVNRLINDMIYFVRDTIMNKTVNNHAEFDALMNFDLDMLYHMIDIINDTLVSIRFSVNQNVHFEVLLVKIAEMVKSQPDTVTNVATTQVASQPNNEVLLQRMEQLENELKTLKAQGIAQASSKQQSSQSNTRGKRQNKGTFSMTNIAKVLDEANKEDIQLLKKHWLEVVDYAKRMIKIISKFIAKLNPCSASEKRVLIQFDEEIHCEIVNRDDEKRTSIENVVRNIINKNVEVVGVPSDQWMRVRTEYINSRKRHDKEENQTPSNEGEEQQDTDVAQKARDLFGEETVHLIDEE